MTATAAVMAAARTGDAVVVGNGGGSRDGVGAGGEGEGSGEGRRVVVSALAKLSRS